MQKQTKKRVNKAEQFLRSDYLRKHLIDKNLLSQYNKKFVSN